MTQPIDIYQTGDEHSIEVRLDSTQETVWLTQAQIADLFEVKPQNITQHLKNIFSEGELAEAATCKDYLQVQREGGRQVERRRKHCNLVQGYALNQQRRERNSEQLPRVIA